MSLKTVINKHYSSILLILIIILSVVLRLYHLNYHDYRDDEIITTLAIRPSINTIFTNLSSYSTHPPLFYMLLHIWGYFWGDHLTNLRLFSVLIGTLCVPMLFMVGSKLFNKPTGFVAATIMAIAPAHILHSQQIRMYPLLTLCVIFSMLAFIFAWRRNNWQSWGLFALVVASAFYTHVYAPFSILSFNVWAFVETFRLQKCNNRQIELAYWKRWGYLIASQAFGLIGFVPFMPQMIHNTNSQTTKWLTKNGIFDWMPAFIEWSNGATYLLHGSREISLSDVVVTNQIAIVALIIGVVVITLTLIASVYQIRENTDKISSWLLIYCLIWIPIVISTFIAIIIRPILISRYLAGISPPLYLLMGWLVVRLWQQRRTLVIATAFLASIIMVLAMYYPPLYQPSERIVFTQKLMDQQQEGDAIAYTYWHLYDTMMLTNPEFEHLYILTGQTYDNVFWQQRTEYTQWHTPDHIQDIETFAPNYRRIWFVDVIYDHDFAYHQQVSRAWLEKHGRLVEEKTFGGDEIVVYLYEIR